MPASIPRAAYQARLDEYKRQRSDVEQRLDRVGLARLIVGAIAGLHVVAVFGPRWLPLASLIVPVVALVVMFAWYGRLKARRAFCLRAEAFHERGLARIDDAWAGGGDAGQRYLNENHLYAADLDLFGRGSLFERLCSAQTKAGQDLLATWLLGPTNRVMVQARQEAVRDLSGRFELRERLALLGEAIPGGFEMESLARWAERPASLPVRGGMLAIHALTIALALAIIGWLAFDIGGGPFAVVLVVQIGFVLSHLRRVNRVLRDIERRAADLLQLAGILREIEAQDFAAAQLRGLRDTLSARGTRPSEQLAQLVWLIDMLNARRSQIFIPVALLFMWGTRWAFLIEAWRVRCGPAVSRWFGVIAEFEALLSLAGYAFERPGDNFPEVVESGPLIQGAGLRHPLMPRGKCVPNDIDLGGELRLLVVSGSNMSGKSTWLRTVGLNAVLALAGAPVPALRLRVSPLAIGATLRIQDSLMAGKSRFYAEITRIQQIMERAKGPLPLLFLFDEILHGTNSHDRGLGAEAIVRALVERGAIGLVTTHDLALAHVAESLAPRAANVHFADHLEGGEMVFDYTMRPGVVRHSNAIALMRMIGLPV